MEEKEKHALYYLCKGLLFPSFFEGFGLPIVEAMSYNKSVFTSNVSSLPEIAGPCGYYSDPYNYEKLKKDLQEYCNNDTLRANLESHTPEQNILFSWDKSSFLTLQIFSDIYDQDKKTNS
ncbi:MAG: glycosyltransferase [Patescibacteria group bacterium]|nr:glycosyltransferase [Patescibacteria group bacterium]